MSWENVNLIIDNFTSSQYLRNDWFDYPNNRNENDIYIAGTNLKDIAIVDGEYHTIFDNGVFKVDFCANTYPNEYKLRCYYQNINFIDISSGGWTEDDYISLAFGIDSDTSQGQVMYVYHRTSWPSGWRAFPNISTSSTASLENAYLAITGSLADHNKSGGAGSGYIGNSALNNKKMVGYNVPTSDVESTKTESTTLYSEGIMRDAAKMGNGGAKITFLRELQWVSLESLVKNMDLSHIKREHVSVNNLSEYFGTDWILVVDGLSQTTRTPWEQIGDKEYHLDAMYPYCELYTYLPLKHTYKIAGIRATVKIADGGSPTSTGVLRINMQSESFTLENQLLYNTKSTSPYGSIDSTITNDVYQTVEKLFTPVDCNYFQWTAVSGEYWNKDIELLVDVV